MRCNDAAEEEGACLRDLEIPPLNPTVVVTVVIIALSSRTLLPWTLFVRVSIHIRCPFRRRRFYPERSGDPEGGSGVPPPTDTTTDVTSA